MRSGEVFMPGNSGRQDKNFFENATIKGLNLSSALNLHCAVHHIFEIYV